MSKGGYTVPMKAFPDMMPFILQAFKDGDEVRLSYDLGYVTMSFHDRSTGILNADDLKQFISNMDNPNNQ